MLSDPSSKEGKERDSGEEKKEIMEKKRKEIVVRKTQRSKNIFLNVTLGTSWHTVLINFNSKCIMNCPINLSYYFLKCTKPST